MKKIFAIVLASLMITSFAACSKSPADSSSTAPTESTASTESVVSEEVSSASEDKAESPDTSDMSNPFVMEKIAIDLPEGFKEEEVATGVRTAVPEDYPTHSDNFTFVSTSFNGDKSAYSKDALEQMYSTGFEGFNGLDEYEEFTVDGCDAIKTKYSITFSGMDMTQQQLCVFVDDQVYMISFTAVSEDYADALDNAIETIKVAK